MATVLLIGTLDTKGPETAYLRDRVQALGCDTLVLDSGILGDAVGITADFTREQVAQAAGTTIEALQAAGTRGKAVEEMLKGVRAITLQLNAAGRLHGVVALGGAEGSVLAAAAMKALPLGVPKLIVSPIASGHRKFAPFVGMKDVMVMHSVVDILGLNAVSRPVFDNAAAAIAGMAGAFEVRRPQFPIMEHLRTKHQLLIGHHTAERLTELAAGSPTEQIQEVKGRSLVTGLPKRVELTSGEIQQVIAAQNKVEKPRPAIAATMLGNTTRPLMHIRPMFETAGYDLVIFHANGVGGPAMEELIRQGYFAAVLDYTLSEVAGFIAGGFHNGGASRLDAAGDAGIPQVIVPGCLDFIVFGAKHEVPESLRDRPMYYHNPEFTLVRLTAEEQLAAAHFLVDKLNRAKGQVSVLVPLGGGSIMDMEGGAFWQPALNEAVRAILRAGVKPGICYREVDAHINDAAFAEAAFGEMMGMVENGSSPSPPTPLPQARAAWGEGSNT